MGKEAQGAGSFNVPMEEQELEKRYEKYRKILAGLTVMSDIFMRNVLKKRDEYYGAAEPPVRCGESHLSGLTEPPIDSYSA